MTTLFSLIMVLLISPWFMVLISQFLQKKFAWKPHQYFACVIRSYLWILVILGAASKLAYLEEKHWVAKDHLGTRHGIFPTKFDALSFDALKKESEILLGPRP